VKLAAAEFGKELPSAVMTYWEEVRHRFAVNERETAQLHLSGPII
jgi:hypothetical protein